MPRHVMVLDTETKMEKVGEDEHHVMKIAWSIFASLDAKGSPIAETWK